MPIRQIDVFVPPNHSEAVDAVFADQRLLGRWQERMNEGQLHVTVMVDADYTETLLDRLEAEFRNVEGFRAVVQPVEAVIPRPTAEPAPEPAAPSEDTPPPSPAPPLTEIPPPPSAPEPRQEALPPPATAPERRPPSRISREELYAKVRDGAQLNSTYLTFTALSTVVAAVGLVRDNVAVIIGAMVIAPLLGPNVALALATTLGDRDLASQALRVATAGFGVALALAFAFGVAYPDQLASHEIMSRTVVTYADILLALASGAAGALAITVGGASALIGVMVAVALLPPLTACGMLFGAGRLEQAWGALLLVLVNLVCVNLAGVATFLLKDIRPRTWWEKSKARRAARWSLSIWLALLILLGVLISVSQAT